MAPEQKMISVRLPLWVHDTLRAYKQQTGIAPATMVRTWATFHCMMMREGEAPTGAVGQLPPLRLDEDPQ